jgi:hypothetical protein
MVQENHAIFFPRDELFQHRAYLEMPSPSRQVE